MTLQTYKATLQNDKIVWQDEKPEIPANGGKVEVYVTVLAEGASENIQLRPFGLGKGKFVVPDDFDAPLPEEILAEFEGR